MRKEKIFSKFNTRTFNNELEEVLANKTFSENVKNNILNMVYKIEEAYNDYELTKVEVQNEKSFLEQILISISDYCNMIEISNSNEMKEKKFIIDYEKGYIKVLANNTWLLYAILEILNNNKKKSYQKEIDMTQNKPIYDFLKLGYNINNVEVIRDFNGWSWINSVDEISNLKANLVYQNLQLLLGNSDIENFIKNIIIQNKDLNSVLQKKLEKRYDKEIINELLKKIKKIATIETAKVDEKYKKILLEIKYRKQEELDLMENKKEYLKEITYIKKTNMELIKGIDKTINNKELLQVEYRLRNSMLKNAEKIFSISYLVDILNDERQEALDKIAEVNNLMEPKTYVKKKEELKNIIDEVNVDDKNTNEIIIELQKIFMKCILEDIKNSTEKVEVLNLLYKIRYYLNILIDENKHIKNTSELKNETNILKEEIIDKLIDNKLVFEFSTDKEINKKIIINILNTRIVNLQTIYITLVKKEDGIKIEIYDEDELVEVEKIELQELDEKNLKLDKKIKIFV